MARPTKSLLQLYKESSSSDILLLVVQPLLGEFLTMVILTFWGSMAALPSPYPPENSTFPEDWQSDYVVTTLMPAFQAGFAVWALIVLFWKICIINFNPAISTGLLIVGVLSPWLYIPYIIMQCLGSILGAVIAKAINGWDPAPALIAEDANVTAIFFCEVMITGIVVFFTNVMVVDKTYDQATGPLSIGMTVFQGIIAGKWVGGGGMNPARLFGPAVVTGGVAWRYHYIWWLGDLTGAIIFSLIYLAFFAPPDKVWMVKLDKKRKRNMTSNRTDSTKKFDANSEL